MTPDARFAELTALRAARKDPLDLPGSMTERERRAYLAETTALDARLAALRSAQAALAALPAADADVKWLAFLRAARGTLEAELLAIKPPIRDDATRERARALGWSIELIDYGWAANRLPGAIIDLSSTRLGALMAAAGYDVVGHEALRGPNGFRGSLAETERRVKDLVKQRTAAQAQLAALLPTEAERTQREAEHQAHRAALATMQVRNNSDGDGLVAFTKNGDPLDPAAMTSEQRQAFEWQQSIS